MRSLIIRWLVFPKNKEQEQEKRKTTIERNWKRRRRRRHFSSRCFFISAIVAAFFSRWFFISVAVAVFSVRDERLFRRRRRFRFCAWKTVPAVSVIKKSEKVLQSLAKFCIFASVRNRKTFSWDSPSMPVGGARWQKRTNMTDIANQCGWYYRVKWLILVRTMAETAWQ